MEEGAIEAPGQINTLAKPWPSIVEKRDRARVALLHFARKPKNRRGPFTI